MATYKQIGPGSEGNEVQTLQRMLNQNGYQLEEDGVYGQQTRDAVADYQQKNNLTVSGTADDTTWTGLESGNSTQTTAPSDAVAQAQALLKQQAQNKPGPYQSQWKDQLNATVEQILNRDKFSYDVNEDMLYQQMVDQYAQQGRLAMMDAIGQAQAMTGGYGNSYAQNVGQQVYQGYLREAADRLPEFYQMALDRYDREGDALLEQYALMGEQEDQDYGLYRDQLADHYAEMDRLQNQYSEERAYDYQQGRDEEADRKWQAEYDEAVRQWEYAQGISDADGNRIVQPTYYGVIPQKEDKENSPQDDPQEENQMTGAEAAAAGFDNNDDLADYLDAQVASGSLTAAQADQLYAANMKPVTATAPEQAASTENDWLRWLAKATIENFPNFGR